MAFTTRKTILDAMNIGMRKVLKGYSKQAIIKLITTPKFITLE